MLFSSITFLWFFLPAVFIIYRLLAPKYRNILLLLASILFYAWGEPVYVVLMLFSITLNYAFGILVDRFTSSVSRKIALAVCILMNLLLLGYFKYFDFFASTVNNLFQNPVIGIRNIVLPIGISFYTFQALSYVIDVYRKETKVQKNYLSLALYVSFFPQLIAGPIVKYHDVDQQILHRELTPGKTAYGVRRFLYGLGKKVILSNTFAAAVDQIFAVPTNELGTGLVWIGVALYTLQIYFDFSGYSDMAIGLGKMFGFDFLENFNYPYISTSIKEFWRRWHISLSTWFREYLYIPLGGNRKGKGRTYLNLLIVFFATGLWHGASFNFVVWGLFHGFFLILERMFLGKILEKNPLKFLNHIYTLVVVMVGWVFFRADGLRHALQLIRIMFVPTQGSHALGQFVDLRVLIFMIFGILFCGIVQSISKRLRTALFNEEKVYLVETVFLVGVLFFSMMLLVSNTYNPFIYFRF